MPQEISHLNQLLTHHLGKDPTVFALLGGPGSSSRIRTSHEVDPEASTSIAPAIIIQQRGGPRQISAPIAYRTFWLWGYARSSADEALRIYNAAADVLQAEGLTPPLDAGGSPCFTLCARCRETSGALTDYNPVARAWWARGTWQALTTG